MLDTESLKLVKRWAVRPALKIEISLKLLTIFMRFIDYVGLFINNTASTYKIHKYYYTHPLQVS